MTPESQFPQSPSSSQVSRPFPQRPLNRPESRLPKDYSPGSSLPPGYIPPARDLLKDGDAIRAREQQPSLTRRQIITLAIGGILLVLMVAAVAAAIAGSVVVGSAIGNPDTTLQRFYSDLRSQDYAHAYTLLSTRAQGTQSEDQFVSHFKQLDTLNGPIADFNIISDSASGSKATATVHFTRDPSQPLITSDSIALVQTNGTWYIDSIVSHNEEPTAKP